MLKRAFLCFVNPLIAFEVSNVSPLLAPVSFLSSLMELFISAMVDGVDVLFVISVTFCLTSVMFTPYLASACWSNLLLRIIDFTEALSVLSVMFMP